SLDLLSHLHRAIARAVFAENQFIAEPEGPQLLAQLQHGTAQDPLLVVDRDHDGDMRLGSGRGRSGHGVLLPGAAAMVAATSRPASRQSSIALYVHAPYRPRE